MKIKALPAFHSIRLIAVQVNYGKMDKTEYRDLQAGKPVNVAEATAQALIDKGFCELVASKKIEAKAEVKSEGGK